MNGWTRICFGVVGWAVATGMSQGATIVGYDASGTAGPLPASLAAASVSAIDLIRGDGLGAASGGTFNSSGWTGEADDYLQWGWMSSATWDLTDMDIRYDRSGTGPTSLMVQLSVDDGPWQTVFKDDDVLETGESQLGIDLSAFQGVGSATFRLTADGAASSTGTFDLEPLAGTEPPLGLVVRGVQAVPEPSAAILLAFGVLCLAGNIQARQVKRYPTGRVTRR